MDYNEIGRFFLMFWLGIGLSWFIYVMVIAYYKGGRLREGTLLGCGFGWPITISGYLYRLKTGRRNQYDPLDLTDFPE